MKIKLSRWMVVLLIGISLVLPGSTSLAAPARSNVAGSLDLSFGNNGKVLTDFGDSDEEANAVVLQPDGKIIAAGNGLARYNTDGTLDLDFGTNGRIASFAKADLAESVALQPDGKIVIAGSNLLDGFCLERYNSDGSVDTTFGTDGVTTTMFGTGPTLHDYAHALVLQPDGKIIAAGNTDDPVGGSADFALARYNSDGSLDTSFDGDGKVITDLGGSDNGYSVALQTDGRIIIAGGSWNGSAYDFALARYNSDGSLDTSFDGDGKLTSDWGGSEGGFAVALQGDGKIVVAGSTNPGTGNSDFVVVRYNGDGSLDTSFDSDGKVITDFGSVLQSDARAVLIQADGKIVAAGSNVLVRYNSNGLLDTAFDGDGMISSDSSIQAAVLQPDGKIVTAGGSYNGLNGDFAVTRYNINGSLDTAFYNDGKVTTDFGGGKGIDGGYAVAVQPDGKIVAAGVSSNGDYGRNFALARYSADGSPDLTFGTDGKVTTDFGMRVPSVSYTNFAQAVAIQPNGKIVVAGSSGNGGSDSRFALARYNANGSLDNTFDTDGRVITDFGGGDTGEGWAVALQPDGKIIVAGDTGYPNLTVGVDSAAIALARYNSNGSLDTTFSGDGKVTTSFGAITTPSIARAYSVAVQPDGKILTAGVSSVGSYTSLTVVRYNANGSLDTTFDGDGKVTTSFGSNLFSWGYDLVLQPDGKIIVAGETRDPTNNFDFVLARYNANGSLDTTFDGDGRVVSDFGTNERAWALALQPDGKIILAGTSYFNSSSNFALVRYNSNGSLDTTFDTDGMATTEFGSNQRGDAALQPDGKIVMVSNQYIGEYQGQPYDYDFALARFIGDAGSTIYYVRQGAAGLNNGASWANAFTDLQSALTAASSGDEIWVAAGTYLPTTGSDRTVSFALQNGVALYGGFAGTETERTQRDPAAHVTILSGDIGTAGNNSDNSYHVVVGSGTDNSAVLDGFTVTAGHTLTGDFLSPDSRGAGMYTNKGSPTIRNVIFTGNVAEHWGGGMYNGGETPMPPATPGNGSNPILTNVTFSGNTARSGGGMENQGYSSPVLTNVIFTGNTATRSGGGMENVERSNPTLTNVVFDGNTAGVGGGMSNILSDPTLTNVTVSGNSAEWGGGMANGYSNPVITNATFYGNSVTTYGGGMSIEASHPSLTNVTFSGNTAVTYGGAIYYNPTSGSSTDPISPTILNGILYGNNSGEIYNASTAAIVTYSLVQGGYTGTGNLDADPGLGTLKDNGGFTQTMALGADSPAVDAGTDAGCPTDDQRGVSRPRGAHCDMGAYEYLDTIAPAVSGVSRVEPAAVPSASVVHFAVAFSEPVTGLDAGDFVLAATGLSGASITSVSGSDAAYTVTANTGTVGAVNGTLHLNVVDNDSIRDAYDNPLGGSGAGNGSFNTGEGYTVAAPVSRPSLLSPVTGFVTNDSTPTFTWTSVPNAARYGIQFASNSDFTQNTDLQFSPDPTFTADALPDGKYYWRVQAYNVLDATGDWSAPRSFTVDTAVPQAPVLTSPADGTSVRSTPTFKWNAVSGAVLYQFELDNDADFSSPLVSAEQRTLSRKPAGTLRGTYYWRVRARDAAGNWGAWSSFSVTIAPR